MGNTFSTRSGNNSRPPRRDTETPQLEPIHKGFNPTRQDIQIAAHILMGLQLQAPPGHLPSELVLAILAHADYCPCITSSQVGRMYYIPHGGQPWYLTIPMLPPDFGRATSLTLQVRSEDHGINQESLFPAVIDHYSIDGNNYPDGSYYSPGDGDEMTDEEHHRRSSTWFQLYILRPLRRSPPSPPVNGYVLDGCVLRKVPEPGVQQTPQERPPSGADDRYPDCEVEGEWLQVRHNGRDTWEIYHHDSQVTAELGGERVNGALTGDSEGTSPRGCKTYRIDCPERNNADSQDPEAFVDGEGFLSALMPGDKIVLSAAAEDPSSGMVVKEAILEILYDVST